MMRFSYAGVDLPRPKPDGMRLELQDIDKAERNANGDMIIELVAQKWVLAVNWGLLTASQAQLIAATLAANRTGMLEYYDIAQGGYISRRVYHGAGSGVTYYRYDDNLELQMYQSYSVNFIEM